MYQNAGKNDSYILGSNEDNSYNQDNDQINNNAYNKNINNNNAQTSQQQSKLKQQQQKDNQRFNIIVRIRPQVEHDTVELTTEDELRHCIFKQGQNKILLNND